MPKKISGLLMAVMLASGICSLSLISGIIAALAGRDYSGALFICAGITFTAVYATLKTAVFLVNYRWQFHGLPKMRTA